MQGAEVIGVPNSGNSSIKFNYVDLRPTNEENILREATEKPSAFKEMCSDSIKIITPFPAYYRRLKVGDAFYYPQRFLSPAFIGFASFVYILFVILFALEGFFKAYITIN